MTQLYTTEHRTVTYVSGPLLIAEHAEHVAYDELVEVVTPDRAAAPRAGARDRGRPDDRPGARRHPRS